MTSIKQDLTELNPRHRKFVKGLLEGKSPSAAGLSAGYTDPGYGLALARQPLIKSLLVAEMEKQGITDGLLARKLKDGLNAQTVPRKEGGQRYDDQFVRKQFLDIVFKVRGDYAPERSEAIEKKIVLIVDGRLRNALLDTGKITEDESKIIDGEIIGDTELPEGTGTSE